MQDHQADMKRVLEALASGCHSDRGAASARLLRPETVAAEAETTMAAILQAEALLGLDLGPTIIARLDIKAQLDLARRSGMLSGEELIGIGRLIRCAERTQRLAEAWRDQGPVLMRVALAQPVPRLLGELLEASFDDEGALLDDASPELSRLRAEQRRRSGGLRTRIAELMRDSDDQGLLQDDYFTVREGRFVLPVKSSDKRQLDGIVHGSSHTGQTVYIEPRELIEANNRLTILNDEVSREERRILSRFSGMVEDHATEIAACSTALTELDLRFAGARLALRLDAHPPRFSPAGQLSLRAGRHPLLVLDGAEVMPNNIELTPPARWLIVSGPNGGGKTVVLTTVGLAVDMARHGLPVCAAPGSVLPWFDTIHVVLGDAQDLDQGLSTFSGHLKQVREVLKTLPSHNEEETPRGDRGPLILLDELASGTEPAAGSALASAILETFGRRRCYGLVSTHYEAVKLLPLRDPSFANAALDLDPRSMAPDFRLRMGEVGSSSPFALADRMALPSEIVERARQIAGGGSRDTELLLSRLRTLRGELQNEVDETKKERTRAHEERARLQTQREHEKREADRRIAQRSTEALHEIAEIKTQLEQLRRRLRKRPEGKTIEQISADLNHQQRRARDLRARATTGQSPMERQKLRPETLQPDAPVWHLGLERLVTIVDAPLGAKRVRVQAGPMQMTATLKELRMPLPGDRGAPKPKHGNKPVPKKKTVNHDSASDDDAIALRTERWTRDVRGMRIEEALDAVDAHVDSAIVANAIGVCIVHGLGTGALRQAVRQHLKKHAQVLQQRPGRRGEGGDGVTLVWVEQ